MNIPNLAAVVLAAVAFQPIPANAHHNHYIATVYHPSFHGAVCHQKHVCARRATSTPENVPLDGIATVRISY